MKTNAVTEQLIIETLTTKIIEEVRSSIYHWLSQDHLGIEYIRGKIMQELDIDITDAVKNLLGLYLSENKVD